jgi:hypothetical protein
MNTRKLLRTVPMIVAILATTWSTTHAEFKDLSEASKQKLLAALRAENITVVLPDQKESVEQLSPEYESQISIIDNSPAPTGIELINGEFCASSDNCGCTENPQTCCQTNCSNCCTNNCSTGCCEPDQGIIAGVEAIFYWVDGNVNGSGDIRTFDVGRNLIRKYNASGVDDDGGLVTPRLWLGYQRGNWGIVGRWWDLNLGDNSADPFDGFVNNNGSGTTSDFRSYAGDIEILRTFCTESCWGNVSFGYRHGRLSSSGSSVTASDTIGVDYVTGTSYGQSSFNGDGITFALEIHKCIGCGVNLFAKARGSVLWGDSKATAAATTTIERPIGGAFDGHFATASGDSGHVSIAEIQAGVEWTHELKCYPAVAFLRCAFEWQTWQGDNDVGAQAWSSSEAIPGAKITSRASAGDQDIDLFGIAISTGFTF